MIRISLLFTAIFLFISCGRVTPPTPTNPTVDPNYGKTHYTWISGVLSSRSRDATTLTFNTNQDIHFNSNGGLEVFIPKRGHNLGKYALVDSNITLMYHDYTNILDMMVRNLETRKEDGKMHISQAAYSMIAWNSKSRREYDTSVVSQNPVVFTLSNQDPHANQKLVYYDRTQWYSKWDFKSGIKSNYDAQTGKLSVAGMDRHIPFNIVHEFQTSGYGDLEVYFVHDSVRINTNAIQGDYDLFLISKDKRSYLRFPRLFQNQNSTPNGILNKVTQCVPLGEEFDLWAMVIHKGRLYYQKKSFKMDSNSKTFTMDTFTPISVEDLMKELDKYTQ